MAGTKQPSDKSHFILPDLGEGVHEAELIRWRVKPGEKVAEHQTLAEMETDKALVEVPSPWAGVIKEVKGKEGDIIKVGSILVTYDIGAGKTTETKSQAAAKVAPATDAVGGAVRGGRAKPNAAAARGGGHESSTREDAGTVVGSV